MKTLVSYYCAYGNIDKGAKVIGSAEAGDVKVFLARNN